MNIRGKAKERRGEERKATTVLLTYLTATLVIDPVKKFAVGELDGS